MAKFCSNCGSELTKNTKTCKNCQAEVIDSTIIKEVVVEEEEKKEVKNTPTEQSNAMAIIAFVVSIISLVACCCFLSPVSLILSIIGLVITKKYTKDYKGFAIAGLVLSIIQIIILIFMMIGIILYSANEEYRTTNGYRSRPDWQDIMDDFSDKY